MRLLQSGIGPARLKLWFVALACSMLAPFAPAVPRRSPPSISASDSSPCASTRRSQGASSFVLDRSDRLVVDVDGAAPGSAAPTGGMVTRTRQAQYSIGTARVVFELSRPAVVAGGAMSNDGRSLLLSLLPVDRAGFARSVHAARRAFAAPSTANAGLQPVVYRAVSPASPLDRTASPGSRRRAGALALNDPLRPAAASACRRSPAPFAASARWS